MKTLLLIVFCLLAIFAVAQKPKSNPNKDAIIKSVKNHQAELIKLSDQIWAFAETALREHKSSKVLADYAEAQGFKVKRGVAGMPPVPTPQVGMATAQSMARLVIASMSMPRRCSWRARLA